MIHARPTSTQNVVRCTTLHTKCSESANNRFYYIATDVVNCKTHTHNHDSHLSAGKAYKILGSNPALWSLRISH